VVSHRYADVGRFRAQVATSADIGADVAGFWRSHFLRKNGFENRGIGHIGI
jgi:hypothetical protein